MDEEHLNKLQDDKWLAKKIKEGRPYQELYGFSDEVMLEFYDVAYELLQEGRLDDAAAAAAFICYLNPSIYDFWRLSGYIEIQRKNWKPAMMAYAAALSIADTDLESMLEISRCMYHLGQIQDSLQLADMVRELAEDQKNKEMLKRAEAVVDWLEGELI